MDDIEKKLNSGNVFIQTQAISVLTESICSRKANEDVQVLLKSEEMKMMWQMVNCESFVLSNLCVESLNRLVAEEIIPAADVMQNFISDIAITKSPTAVLRGITCLLIITCHLDDESYLISPFTGPPKGPCHPYVVVVKRRPELISAVVEEIQFIVSNENDSVEKSWKSLLESFLYFCFCSSNIKNDILHRMLIIIATTPRTLNDRFILMLCNIASSIQTRDGILMERKILILSQLSGISLATRNIRLFSAVLPCIVLAIRSASKYGLSTRTLEKHLVAILRVSERGCDVTLCAIADSLPMVSGELQVTFLKSAATLLSHNDSNALIGCRLLANLVQILSASSSAVPHLSSAADALVTFIQALPSATSANTHSQLSDNEYWDSFSMAFPNSISLVPTVQLCDKILKDDNAKTWLQNLFQTVHQLSSFHYSIVISVFLHDKSNAFTVIEAIKIFERQVREDKNLALELFPVILYRLGREKNPAAKLEIIYLMPCLAVNQLCVPMILKTFTAFWGSKLKALVLTLMLKTWKIESRVYPYLIQMIQEEINLSDTALELSKAYVVSQICKIEPSQHGTDLVPLLSSILNRKTGRDGTAETVFALEGIYDLCSAKIIDMRSTWKCISPKLLKDKRPQVISKICHILSLVPVLKVGSKEYESFTTDILVILWAWCENKVNTVSEAAFKSLENFDQENFYLKMLPSYAREGHKLPAKYASTPFEAARKAEDVLDYVPGLAWVKMVTDCPKNSFKSVENLVKSIIEREVMNFPKGIYLTAIQEAKRKGYKKTGEQYEPANYEFLPETSIMRYCIAFLQDFSKVINEAKRNDDGAKCEKLLQGSESFLHGLGQRLKRPFPLLDWSFLEEVYAATLKWEAECNNDTNEWSTKILHGIFSVIAQQCNKSPSALNLISKWIDHSNKSLSKQDELYLFGILDQISRGLDTTILQKFLNYVLTKAVSDELHLKQLLIKIKPHLNCEYIQDTNRSAIGNAIENLNEKICLANAALFDSYKSCVADLPHKNIERLTSPSLWWEITDKKLYRATALRCHVAAVDPENIALPWLNDLVDYVSALPGDRSKYLLSVSNTLVRRSNTEESSAWLLSLLGNLSEKLKKDPGNNLVSAHEHQQKISFYLDILVMGFIVWSGVCATCSLEILSSSIRIRSNLLSVAMHSLIGRSDWRPVLPHVLNWFVSSHERLSSIKNICYDFRRVLLLLATSEEVSETLWNKIVSFCTEL